jgi:CubicO group peptidase (beta-lactamase class C family)
MKYYLLVCLAIFLNLSCDNDEQNDDPVIDGSLYFPPISNSNWQTTSAEDLGWQNDALSDLLNYLETNNTRAFIILKDGKIVIEEYWGENILGTANFGQNTRWYWASAGKTITATLTGIAQQEEVLNINDKTSDYLGDGWTSLMSEKENLITIKDQLSMTTGLDYDVNNLNCTTPTCLQYKADAGAQWFYHNAPYTLLRDVIEAATQLDYNQYTDEKIEHKIGMNGEWFPSNEFNNVYWSNARDMARFGLLMLNKGVWDNTAVLEDTNYYNDMINSSQDLNLSYGYLWWLNGKDSVILPSFDFSFNMKLANNAPDDLVAGMGKDGQFVEFVPSQNIVVIRMGEAPEDSLVPTEFHNDMWSKIAEIIAE